jgi:hypothetical protein
LQSTRNREKFDSNAPTKVNCNEEKQKKQPQNGTNTATNKKRDEEPGGRGGKFFYDRRHKKWHIQKAIFHSKRI